MCIKARGLRVEERAFTLSEAYAAREAFVTAASQIVLPVVRIDGHAIGDGKPGPIATALRRALSPICGVELARLRCGKCLEGRLALAYFSAQSACPDGLASLPFVASNN